MVIRSSCRKSSWCRDRRKSISKEVEPVSACPSRSTGIGRSHGHSDKTAAMLLGDLAALGPAQRRVVAKELRKVSETFAEVAEGRDIARTLGLLAHWLDPTAGQ